MTLGRQLFYAGGCLFELARGVMLAAVVLVLLHLFVATIFVINGVSMEPNFHSGEVILVDRVSYLTGTPARGDVAVLKFPGDPDHKKYIKRIVGLPGETIDLKDDAIYINDERLIELYLPKHQATPIMVPGKTHWQLGSDDYFLVGDNRANSNDSRTWDQAEQRFFVGKAIFVLWPKADSGFIPNVYY